MEKKKQKQKDTLYPKIPKSQMTLKEQIRDRRYKIGLKIDAAKTEATIQVLRQYCHEVDVDLEKRFCQVPVMVPKKCPSGHGCFCDTCDYLVQYSLKNKKVWCINRLKDI